MERRLVGRAVLLTAATVWGALVSLRADVDGEPLGLRSPGPVAAQVALGLGSGLSAPWPMPAAVWAAVLRGHPGDPRARRTCAVVGCMLIAGVLVEPVTWGQRQRSLAVASTVVANVLAAVGLITAGRR